MCRPWHNLKTTLNLYSFYHATHYSRLMCSPMHSQHLYICMQMHTNTLQAYRNGQKWPMFLLPRKQLSSSCQGSPTVYRLTCTTLKDEEDKHGGSIFLITVCLECMQVQNINVILCTMSSNSTFHYRMQNKLKRLMVMTLDANLWNNKWYTIWDLRQTEQG